MKVVEGEKVSGGEVLREGWMDGKEVVKVSEMRGVEEYLVHEVEKVYGMEGVEMGDKDVEVMVGEMVGKVGVV
ncbi:hypothetical protein, partial [Bacillus pumilus]|uniref:hypothetical protein n=1 Tax=Bacillus pumilus TaxID=1408 RepID=UPI0011A85373